MATTDVNRGVYDVTSCLVLCSFQGVCDVTSWLVPCSCERGVSVQGVNCLFGSMSRGETPSGQTPVKTLPSHAVRNYCSLVRARTDVGTSTFQLA